MLSHTFEVETKNWSIKTVHGYSVQAHDSDLFTRQLKYFEFLGILFRDVYTTGYATAATLTITSGT